MTDVAAPYALGTFAVPRHPPFAGLAVGDRVLDLACTDLLDRSRPLTMRALLESWDTVRPALAQLAAGPDGSWHELATLDVRAPIGPRQVIAAGANYRTHVLDLAVAHAEISAGRSERDVRVETAQMMGRRAAEGVPYFFIDLAATIGGPYDDVVLRDYSEQHDWELELAAVIERTAYLVGRGEALEHVAAYTIVNDLTTRDLVFRRDLPEIGTDWFRAKNAPGFLPLGPFLVPSEYVGDPADLRLTLRLNGETMQDESAKDMIFDVAALVSAASQTLPLLPGDLVLTGSPTGNGLHHGRLLRAGDVMEATITGLGTQRTRCVAQVRR